MSIIWQWYTQLQY